MSITLQNAPARERVLAIDLPDELRSVAQLGRIDYQDAFLVDVGPVGERTAEGWARLVLEDAPAPVRSYLLSGWTALGLNVGLGRSDGAVLGWEVRRSTCDLALLGAGARLGLVGQLIFQRREDSLLCATLVRLDNPIAQAAWAAIEPVHVQVVRRLLEQASRRARP